VAVYKGKFLPFTAKMIFAVKTNALFTFVHSLRSFREEDGPAIASVEWPPVCDPIRAPPSIIVLVRELPCLLGCPIERWFTEILLVTC